jgi:Na+/proline symporter
MAALHWIDALILAAFVVASLGVGLWIPKLATRSIRGYFLGGNTIPWYLLGVSNASGMFDISGTMLMVTWLFVYGLKSVWVPWLWPVFNQVLLMAYLSVWLRRSGVVTGADWIRFRFGDGRGARMAHLIVVAFALINVVGFLAYGFIGIGKFAASFSPLVLSADPTTNNHLHGLAVTAVTTLYVVKGGMYGVVFTEVLQYLIMTAACLGVGMLALWRVAPADLEAAVPAGWRTLWFGHTLDLDWNALLPAAAARIRADGWELFSLFVGMALFKGILSSMAGPAPNYDMQRVLSARTPREAALMSGLVSLVLLVPRYMLVTGLAVLVLTAARASPELVSDGFDFELVLPLAMREFVPVGLFGLLLAALLAAFMSTYAATVNAAPAYIVNDIYKRHIRPAATDRDCMVMSYASSILIVVIGTVLGLVVGQLTDVLNWIVGCLYGGYIAANLLKWHWWRLNGWGYFWGMLAGIAAAIVAAIALRDQTTILGLEKNLAAFPAIMAVSIAASVAGSLLTPPDDPQVLERFYLQVRPWGLWNPVYASARQRHPGLEPNRDMPRDLFNVAIGIVWQTALTVLGIVIVLRDVTSSLIALAVAVGCMAVLKWTWYDRLQDEPDGGGTDRRRNAGTAGCTSVGD